MGSKREADPLFVRRSDVLRHSVIDEESGTISSDVSYRCSAQCARDDRYVPNEASHLPSNLVHSHELTSDRGRRNFGDVQRRQI